MDSPICPRPDCRAGILRVERCQEFRTVRHRWVCAVGHSGFLADDLPDYGRPVEAWGRRGVSVAVERPCGECDDPLPPGTTYQRQFHPACSVSRNARLSREIKSQYDVKRGAERRSTRRAGAA